jgi:virginiamycin A acetyltransferase
LESTLPENSDWISCSGCENSRISGKKPNFDPKPQKPRNDSSYQFDDDLIRYLLELKWWDWSAQKVFENLEILCSDDLTKIKEIK